MIHFILKYRNIRFKIFTLSLICCISFLVSTVSAQTQCSPTPVKEAIRNGSFEAGFLSGSAGVKHTYTSGSDFDFQSDLNFAGVVPTTVINNTADAACLWGIGDQYAVSRAMNFSCAGTAYTKHPYYGTEYIDPVGAARWDFTDHTPGKNGMGYALVADVYQKKTSTLYPGEKTVIWEQTVDIYSNQIYWFSGWIANYNSNTNACSQPALKVKVTGVRANGTKGTPTILPITGTSSSTMVWNQFRAKWTPDDTYVKAVVTLQIDNTECSENGLDMVLDDLSFINTCQNIDAISNPFEPNLGADTVNFCGVASSTILLQSNVPTNGLRKFYWYSGTGATQTELTPSGGSLTQNTYTVNANGTYRVCIEDLNNNTCAVSDIVLVEKSMTITLPGANLCSPAVATMQTTVNPTTGSKVYTWTVPSGVASPGNNSSFQTSTAGNYFVTVTNPDVAGCSAITSAIVTSSLATFTPINTDQCYGSTITVVGTGANKANYKWYTVATGGTAFATGANANVTLPSTGSSYTIYLADETQNPISGSPIIDSPSLYGTGVFEENFTVSKALHLTSVEVKPENGVGTCQTTNPAPFRIEVVSGGSVLQYKDVSLSCGTVNTAVLDFDLLPGSYTLRIQKQGGGGQANGWFGLFSNNPTWASYTIPGYIAVTGNAGGWAGPFGKWAVVEKNNCDRVPVVIPIKSCCTPPTINSITAPTVCTGQSLNLTANAMHVAPGTSVNYTWSGPSSFSVTNSANTVQTRALATSAMTGTYTVTITDNLNCATTTTVVATVNTTPTASITGTTTVCNGVSTILTAAGGGTYAWDGGSTNANRSVTPTINTTYTVTVTSNGCSDTETSVVTVNANPTASITGTTTICNGFSTTITANGVGSYSWDGGTTAAYRLVSPTSNTTYTLTVTSNGCTDTETTVVTVNANPTANAGSDVEICIGQQTANLTATGGGTYAWSNSTATAANAVTPAILTTYTVTVTNAQNCTHSDAVVVTVNTLPTAAITDKSVCAGSSATLSATNLSTGATSYAWSDGTTTANLTKTIATTTTYTVTATDAKGCTDIEDGIITINANPVVDAGGPYKTCKTASVQINATNTVGWTYAWAATAGGQTSANTNNPLASHTTPLTLSTDAIITYTVTVTDQNNCSHTDNALVTFEFDCSPSVNLSTTKNEICYGESTTIKADTHSVKAVKSFKWSDATLNTVGNTATSINPTGPLTVSPQTTTTYTATITDINDSMDVAQVVIKVNPLPTAAVTNDAVCHHETATLTASGGGANASYKWSDGTTITATFTLTPPTASTYTVTLTDAKGCSDTEQGIITLNPVPTVDAGDPQIICKTETATLTSTTNATTPSYLWTGDAGTTLTTATQAIAGGKLQNNNISLDQTHTYTVSVTDNNGCTNTDNTTITYQAMCQPTVILTGDTAICKGESTTITATITSQKALTLTTWSDGTTSSGVTFTGTGPTYTVTVTVSPQATTTYTLIAEDNTQSEGQGTIVINVHANPTANIADQQVCPNTSATLTATGAGNQGTYLWSNTETTASITINPATVSTYTVTATNLWGCSDVEDGIITLYAPPSLTPMSDKRTCKTSSITLTPTQDATWTYQWTSTPASSLTTATSAIPTVSYLTPNALIADASIMYTVTVTDNKGCTSTDDIQITYEFTCKPYIYPEASDYVLCYGQSTTITAPYESQKPVTGLLWSEASFNTVGNTTTSINTTGPFTITPTADMTITAYIYDDQGKGDTASITIKVNPLPTPTATSNSPICEKQTLNLTATPANNYYNWSGPVSFTSTSDKPNRANATTQMSGTYQVTVTDNNTCSATAETIVTVNALPNADAGQNAAICPTTSTSLTATGGISYLWNTTEPSAQITVSPTTSPSNYTVTVTDANNCSQTDYVTVVLFTTPTVNATKDFSICNGYDTTITALGNGTTYTWSEGTINQTLSIVPTQTNTYTVTSTTQEGCTQKDDITVTVNQNPTADAGQDKTLCIGNDTNLTVSNLLTTTIKGVRWSTGETINPITVKPNQTTTYTVTITDQNNCTSKDDMVVTINQKPLLTYPSISPVCVNDNTHNIDLATPTGLTGVYWGTGVTGTNFDATQHTPGIKTINYRYTNPNNCTDTITQTVEVLALPEAIVADQSICEGESATLINTGSQNVTYQWDDNTTQHPKQVSPTGTQTYTVTLTNPGGCTDVEEAVVTVNPIPTVDINTPDRAGCEAHTATFTDATTPSGVSYTWVFGDGEQATTSDRILSHTYQTAGIYDVKVTATTAAGCTADSLFSQYIEVKPLPIALFTFNPTTPTNFSPEVNFKDASYEDITNWAWDFADEDAEINQSSDQHPKHSFTKPGRFNVKLTVTAANNCTDEYIAQVYVKGDHTLYTPNAFTPNNDGINETFMPVGVGIDENTFNFYVYTRWGESVFETHKYNDPWDGRKRGKGEVLQDDVYTWLCTFKDLEGNEFSYKGAVTLVH